MHKPKASVIIAAGGIGARSGLGYPKQFFLLNGKELLRQTLDIFDCQPFVGEIIIAGEPESIERTRAIAAEYKKISAVISGGRTRQESVRAALKCVSPCYTYVLVHDAVRPFVTDSVIKAVFDGAVEHNACLPAVRPRDSMKIITNGFVSEDLPREQLGSAQTPQGFLTDILLSAYEKAAEDGLDFCDDSAAVRFYGTKIKVVDGSYENIKMTTKSDFRLGS